jgi:small subunit ribosomal protein S6
LLRQYETTFIVDAHLPTEQIDKSIERVSAFIEKHNGKVKNVNRWGKRRLAYEIAKKQYGYYVYVRFEADGTFIKEFQGEFKLDNSILRMLTVLIDKAVMKNEQLNKADSMKKQSIDYPENEDDIDTGEEFNEAVPEKEEELDKVEQEESKEGFEKKEETTSDLSPSEKPE